ncbi:GNAT family N-acetyltransferase [Mycetocola saprophilus]|uniref:GNAT family N-acetyltransferase n=1 Tax=Mycetocola saprophilus TaxID=76636 RepID=UPI001B8002C4|nr:GNAT family N-acetyltransferase [Mycetocola saprophilus]
MTDTVQTPTDTQAADTQPTGAQSSDAQQASDTQRASDARAAAVPATDSAGATVSHEEFVYVSPEDPRVEPLIRELAAEYDHRYGDLFGEPASAELYRYPAENFLPPIGAFALLMRDGVAVAGGAFKRFDQHTTEFKRIWVSSQQRRQGLAKRVLAELEDESRRRGFTRAYLTTGPRQPEAVRLYLGTGWTPLFDPRETAEQIGIYGFAKSLTAEDLDAREIQARYDAERAEFLPELQSEAAGESSSADAAGTTDPANAADATD